MESYVVCPYFIRERKLSITCEDTIRHYPSLDEKLKHMDAYCYTSWKGCPFARKMDRIYNQDISIEKIKEQIMENRIEEQAKEINKLMSENGKLKRKVAVYENQLVERDKVFDKTTDMYLKQLKEKDKEIEQLRDNLDRKIRENSENLKLIGAKNSLIKWLESFAAAFLVVAYGAGTRTIKMSKGKVDKLMRKYELDILAEDDGSAFIFQVTEHDDEKGAN